MSLVSLSLPAHEMHFEILCVFDFFCNVVAGGIWCDQAARNAFLFVHTLSRVEFGAAVGAYNLHHTLDAVQTGPYPCEPEPVPCRLK